mgnify:CR=1 FL=1
MARYHREYKKGSEHAGWKGGRLSDKSGYVLVYSPEHSSSNSNKYVREHRLVMEKHLGRFLNSGEVVHHINGIRNDNRIENLQLFQTNGEHLRHERTGKVPNWSEDGKKQMIEAHHNWANSGNTKWRKFDKSEIVYLYHDCGWLPDMIARKIHTNSETVGNLLREYGYTLEVQAAYKRITLTGVVKLKENPEVLESYARRSPVNASRLKALCDKVHQNLSETEYLLVLLQVFPQSRRIHEMALKSHPHIGPYRPQGRK